MTEIPISDIYIKSPNEQGFTVVTFKYFGKNQSITLNSSEVMKYGLISAINQYSSKVHLAMCQTYSPQREDELARDITMLSRLMDVLRHRG